MGGGERRAGVWAAGDRGGLLSPNKDLTPLHTPTPTFRAPSIAMLMSAWTLLGLALEGVGVGEADGGGGAEA